MSSERENEITKGGYYFISYSAVDGRDFALRLTAALERGALLLETTPRPPTLPFASGWTSVHRETRAAWEES